MNKITHQVFHHSGDSSKEDQFEKIKAYHISKGWGDIGYPYVIERSGDIIEGRPLDIRGAHCVNSGAISDLSGLPYNTINGISIGYCLAGDFTQEKPTQAQIRALHDLSFMHQLQFGIPDEHRFLHRELKATSCPGVDLRALVDQYHIEYLKKRLKSAKKAVGWANPLRRAMLLRFIARIKNILFPITQ